MREKLKSVRLSNRKIVIKLKIGRWWRCCNLEESGVMFGCVIEGRVENGFLSKWRRHHVTTGNAIWLHLKWRIEGTVVVSGATARAQRRLHILGANTNMYLTVRTFLQSLLMADVLLKMFLVKTLPLSKFVDVELTTAWHCNTNSTGGKSWLITSDWPKTTCISFSTMDCDKLLYVFYAFFCMFVVRHSCLTSTESKSLVPTATWIVPSA